MGKKAKTVVDKSDQLLQAAQIFRNSANCIDFSSYIPWVYNPLEYAWESHSKYVLQHFQSSCKTVFVGMNPGPWGMSQTGIPFGEVTMVRDWLAVSAKVLKPKHEHPKRPVEGLNCQRIEVSGQRFWGLFKETFGQPKRFFKRHFVISYCPLAFMAESGANVTPDKLPAVLRAKLQAVCDQHLVKVVDIIQPEWIIGVGNWAAQRCRAALTEDSTLKLGQILHPSPASPAANNGWADTVRQQLRDLGVW